MSEFIDKYGKWGLVAGAAEGLGEAYSRSLASRGMNVLLVDKNKEAMEQLAGDLENNYRIETRRLCLDLAGEDSAIAMLSLIQGLDCRLLVYNAAHSQVKRFCDHSMDELDVYLDVNCRTMIKTVHGFIKHLKQFRSGGILLMSSLAGLWGTQLVATYGATKAFTLKFAEALYHELREDGIDIMACIAGATATPAYLSTRPKYGTIKPPVMGPEKVSENALKQLGRKAYCIPGLSNKLTFFIMTRVLPGKSAAKIINQTMRKMYS